MGHTCVDPKGEECYCGLRGCLETLIGDDALSRRARALGVIGAHGTKDDLNRAAVDDEPGARDIFGWAARHLGQALANLIHVLDPEQIHVSGEGVDVWQFWEPEFKKSLREHLPAHRRDLQVVVQSWAEDTWAHGAASLVFASPFSSRRGGFGDEVRELLRSGA